MVLLPKSHPLAAQEAIPVENLKTEPFIESYPGMETDITLIFDKIKARPMPGIPRWILRPPMPWSRRVWASASTMPSTTSRATPAWSNARWRPTR